MPMERFRNKVQPNRPGHRRQSQGREQGAGEGAFFRVVTCVADGILQKVNAGGEKYDEKEKTQILFFSHTDSLSPQAVVPVQYRGQLLLSIDW
jgi:hypothetical protein